MGRRYEIPSDAQATPKDAPSCLGGRRFAHCCRTDVTALVRACSLRSNSKTCATAANAKRTNRPPRRARGRLWGSPGRRTGSRLDDPPPRFWPCKRSRFYFFDRYIQLEKLIKTSIRTCKRSRFYFLYIGLEQTRDRKCRTYFFCKF